MWLDRDELSRKRRASLGAASQIYGAAIGLLFILRDRQTPDVPGYIFK